MRLEAISQTYGVSAFRRTVMARLPAFALRASAGPRRSSAEYSRSGGGKPDTTYAKGSVDRDADAQLAEAGAVV